MYRRKPNRTRLDRRARRGLEAVFWITFALAIGVGGPSAVAGLPKLGDMITPVGVLEAQASAGGRDFVSLPLVLHFRPIAKALHEAVVYTRENTQPTKPLPVIALVIDDMGNDVTQNRRAIALPKEVSLSFLPYPSETPRLAEAAKRAGHEILVHVPMEAPSDRDGSLAMALRRSYVPEENVRRLDWALSRVPGYSGINNHEGSVFTADRLALVPVAEALYGRGIFFLDSRTTPLSQIVPVARAFGVPSSDRDVFLDDQGAPVVERQLQELEKVARENGVAIAIGHPHPATLDVVSRWCAQLHGYRLVPVSVAIRMKTELDVGMELAAR